MRDTTTTLVGATAPAGVKAFQREMLKPFEMPMQMDNGQMPATQLQRPTYLRSMQVMQVPLVSQCLMDLR